MHLYRLTLGVLCVWRLTHLLSAEDGPWELIVRLRSRVGSGFWGGLLDCFYCLSLWTAVPFAYFLGDTWSERLLMWPALSAGAILLERATSVHPAAPPATYFEDEAKENVLSRPEKSASSGTGSEPPVG